MASIDPASLRLALERANMTQKQLREATGLSAPYVSEILSGKRTLERKPDIRTKIAKAVGVPIHWIEKQDVPA